MTSAGRPDAPVLLVTKLHPPSVPAQTIARERLFERLRDGRGPEAQPRRVPGRVRQVDAARRVAGGGGARAARRVGDARRGRQRRGRAVVARDRGARPRLPGARGRGPGRAGPRRAAARGGAAAARQRARRAGRASCSCSTTSTGSPAPPARESVAWFVDYMPATLQLVLSTRADPALPLGALRAHGQLLELRADDLRFTRAGGGRVPQRPPRARPGRRRRRPARRADRGLARRDLPGGAVAGGQAGQGRRWCGPSTARARTSSTSSRARCSAPTSRSCRRSCSARRCSSGCARRCATRCSSGSGSAAALESLARSNLFLLPLDDQRRWFRFHHLFAQLLRVELERREPAAVAGAAPARVRVARRVRHDRRGDPPRRRGARVRRGRRADRRDVGPLRQRRPDVVRPRLAAALPRGDRSTPTPRLLLVQAWVSALRGREARHARARSARAARARRARGGPAAGRLRLARVEPLRAERGVRVGRRGGDRSSTARARPSSKGRSRRGGRSSRWSLGWGHYCNGELDLAERWLRETAALAPGGRPVDRRHRRDRRPLADRGPARPPRRSSCGWRTEAVEQAREHGLLEAREVGEVHTAHGVALAAHGPPRGGAARARAGRVPAPAVGPAARSRRRADRARAGHAPRVGDRERAADAVPRGGGAPGRAAPTPGVLPERLAAARARRPPPAGRGAERARARRSWRLLSGGLSEREIGRELFLSFNTVHTPREVRLPQARRVSSRAEAVAISPR